MKRNVIFIPCFYDNAGGRLQSGGTERKADEVCGVPGNGSGQGIL